MTTLDKALSLALVHSLWEGALIATFLFAALRIAPSPRLRYAIAGVSLLAILAAFAFTVALLARDWNNAAAAVRSLPAGASLSLRAAAEANSRTSASGILSWIAPFWLAGVVLFHLRTVIAWRAADALRSRGACCPPHDWLERLDRLRRRIQVSGPVTLLESSLARVPAVSGWLRPAILVPAGMLTATPTAQMEAILLHELAHIRRHDYLVNLLQTIVEGFLFYHPAVWWISGVIRAERESCCDSIVVAHTGNAYEYSTALTSLGRNHWPAESLAMGAAGGPLLHRVRRVLYSAEQPGVVPSPLLSAGVLALTLAVALAAWQTQTPPPRMEAAFQKWIDEDAAYIATPEERAAFARLRSAEEREKFVEQFWLRRDPTPGTGRNEAKEEHYRRIAWVNEHFMDGGWKSDRGRIHIVYGPPDEMESHPSMERWRYRYLPNVGNDVIVEFVEKDHTGKYQMTRDPNH